jgi:N-acetylglutamate synthase-like GNAT family acetyltransferase
MSTEPSILARSFSESAPDAGYSIRRATLGDLDSAFELVKEYFEAVGVWLRDSESEFRDYLVGNDRGVWLACAGSEPVGCIALHPQASQARSGEIKRLYVKPAHRRQGLAEGLLNALEEFAAKTAAYEWLYLDSKDDLVTAIRFYELRGYKQCDRYNKNPQATIFMRKRLANQSFGQL